MDYLKELRDEACQRCGATYPGDSLPGPEGTACGMKLPLTQLIDALHNPTSRGEEECRHPDYCPVRRVKLAKLAKEAAQFLEDQRARREKILENWND
ncbi:MAG: hypothetical protein ACKO23_13405 [Gemmataceae bacterium]